MQELSLDRRVRAFAGLGKQLKKLQVGQDDELNRIIVAAGQSNQWFTRENIQHAMSSLSDSLEEEKLTVWLGNYPGLRRSRKPLNIGVINAGNIPFVGFNDMASVVLSGHIYKGKNAGDD